MKRVAIVTKNAYLGQKIKLALEDFGGVIIAEKDAESDVCFWDIDSFGDAPLGAVTMSRNKECGLSVPFSFNRLFSFFKGEQALLSVDSDRRSCTLRGKKIKLTELEGALLSLLVFAGGEYVSRDKILSEVWGNDADAGIINVYIHYLREKLESGEKIILASRGAGYRIDKRFLGGEDA